MSACAPRRAILAWAVACVMTSAVGTALAQAPAEPPPAAGAAAPPAPSAPSADALYAEGNRLMQQGDFTRACPMLEESHRIDPAPGALLAVARCHEKAGHLATAWGAYGAAAELARAAGDTAREAAARQQVDLIGPRLPRLVLRLDAGWPPGTRVTRDGVLVDPAQLGTLVAVDPGPIVIEVRAGDHVERRALVAVESRTLDVMVPAPRAASAPVVTQPPPAAPVEDGLGGPGIAGLVVGGVGLGALGAASVLGLVAAGHTDDADQACAPFRDGSGGTAAEHGTCVAALDDARSAADPATVLFVVGGVLVATGVTLVIVDRAGADDAPLVVHLVPAGPGIAARGTF